MSLNGYFSGIRVVQGYDWDRNVVCHVIDVSVLDGIDKG